MTLLSHQALSDRQCAPSGESFKSALMATANVSLTRVNSQSHGRWSRQLRGPLAAGTIDLAGLCRTDTNSPETLVVRVLTETRGPIVADCDGPATRKVGSFGPSEHRSHDVGLNAASHGVGQVFELFALRGAHPTHDTNAALARSMRVVCCHASTPTKSRLEPIRRVWVSDPSTKAGPTHVLGTSRHYAGRPA
jgi:hypothetical protein